MAGNELDSSLFLPVLVPMTDQSLACSMKDISFGSQNKSKIRLMPERNISTTLSVLELLSGRAELSYPHTNYNRSHCLRIESFSRPFRFFQFLIIALLERDYFFAEYHLHCREAQSTSSSVSEHPPSSKHSALRMQLRSRLERITLPEFVGRRRSGVVASSDNCASCPAQRLLHVGSARKRLYFGVAPAIETSH